MRIIALPALLALAACGDGGSDQAQNTADQLEEAAEQSDPAAAQVLENAADRIEDGDNVSSAGGSDAAAQQALSDAGNTQLEATPLPDQE